MVVVGPRPIVASSALPSKTKPLQQQSQEKHQHSDSCVAHEYSVDMRKFRTSNAVDRCLATELKEVKECVGVNTNSTSLKCPPMTYAFVYGTLKKGFSNYWLMEDVCSKGHARFLGFARTKEMFPMVCGPYQVPFLIDIPSLGHHVRGELYEVRFTSLKHLFPPIETYLFLNVSQSCGSLKADLLSYLNVEFCSHSDMCSGFSG